MWWLIRSVRRSRWTPDGTAPVSREFTQTASADLIPRPIDNGGLSVYQIPDSAEEKLTATLHVVLTRKPETVHFLRIRRDHFQNLPLEIEHEFSPDQHPYLKERHRNIYGITAELSVQIAGNILSQGADVLTITAGEIRTRGVKLLEDREFAAHIAFPNAYRR